MMLSRRLRLAALALNAALLDAVPARADHAPELAAGLVDVGIVLPAIALSIPNVVHVARGRQPPLGWPIAGLVLGGLGAALSGLVLTDIRPGDDPALAIGGAVGSGVVVGFAIWAWLQPARPESRLLATLRLLPAPTFARDLTGRPAFGFVATGLVF